MGFTKNNQQVKKSAGESIIENNSHYILDNLSTAAILEQLTEECCELGQASAKLARIYRGENPTPTQVEDAIRNLREEFTDVMICTTILDVNIDIDVMINKLNRWKNRIESSNKKEPSKWMYGRS